MSIKVMSAVFEATIGSPAEKLILLALADFSADDGACLVTSDYPSVPALARKCDLSERACQRALRRLTGKYLEVDREATHRSARTYRLSVAAIRGDKMTPLPDRGDKMTPLPDRGDKMTPLPEVRENVDENAIQGVGSNLALESTAVDLKPLKLVLDLKPLKLVLDVESKDCVRNKTRTPHDHEFPHSESGAKTAAPADVAPRTRKKRKEALDPTDYLPTPTLREQDKETHKIRYVLTCFDLAFRDKIGEPYPGFTGKEAKLVENLLKKKLSVDKLEKMVRAYFDLGDEWVHNTGYDFGVFYSQRAKLVVKTSAFSVVDPYANYPKAPPPPPGWKLEPLRKASVA